MVGSHVLFDLCRSGERVRAIKRSESAIENVKKVFAYYSTDPEVLLKKIDWVDADLMDVYSLMEAMEGVSEVYHCAAMVSFEAKHEKQMMATNAEGTANMVNAALVKGVKKFCHVSSVATIGVADKGELAHEETFWKASPENSNYSISKYAAEREVWRAAAEGLEMVIVNPSLIIGAGNWQQSSSNMFSKAYKGIKFYTEGATGFVDVRDVSKVMLLLMKSEIKNKRFLLNSENKTFRSFFEIVHREFGKPVPTIKAGKILSSFAWRAESVRYALTGETPLITKETATSAHKINRYSNQGILNAFPDLTFIPVEESIKDTCRLFLKEK